MDKRTADKNKKEKTEERKFSCVDCGVLNCWKRDRMYPDFCPTAAMDEENREELIELYREPENLKVTLASAAVESEYYGAATRVEEIMHFAEKIGARKLGIASCVGLIREARTLTEILRSHNFEVVGAVCKMGSIPKSRLGAKKIRPDEEENMCNPILQAKFLNHEKTDLNLVVGLCVGHDSLFYKYSDALCTTVVTKDRVLGHNPAAALYTADSYYKRLKK